MRPASVARRTVGFLLDRLIVGVVVRILAWRLVEADAWAWFWWVQFAVDGVYVIVLTVFGGQTIGKRLMGTRVVADHGGPTALPISWGTSFVRWAVLTVPAAVPVFGAILAVAVPLAALGMMVLDGLGRGLHDRLAGTRVVDVRTEPRPSAIDRQRAIRRTSAGPTPRYKRRRSSPS